MKFPKLQIKPLERGAVLVVVQVLTSAARSGLSVRDLHVPMQFPVCVCSLVHESVALTLPNTST